MKQRPKPNKVILSLSLLVVASFILLLSSTTSYISIENYIPAEAMVNEQVTEPPLPSPAATIQGFADVESAFIEASSTDENMILPVEEVLFDYIKVIDSCGPNFEGECVNVRAGPGTEYEAFNKMRNGVILKVSGKIEKDGEIWYKIVFDEWIRYPERVKDGWYISGEYVHSLRDAGQKDLTAETELSSIEKHIVVDKSEQMLRAYESNDLFMEQTISTGLALTPTPNGTFHVFRKTPSRYMQGPIEGVSSQYWDLPGVPWNLYFTHGGAIIHGAYWHNNFGQPWSKGCVNVPLSKSQKLYNWAPLGTKVIIQE